MLPEGKKDGSIFAKSTDFQSYMQIYVASFLVFAGIYQVWKGVFTFMKHPPYMTKDAQKKLEYLSLWTANTHHLTIFLTAIWVMCNSECEGAYPFIFLYDPVCFYTQDNLCVKSVLVTCGYLTYDFILYRFFMDQKDPLNRQTIWHHIVGTSGLFCALYTGYGLPSVANVALICELSTIFINYRSMYSKEQLNATLPLINQIVFFITFTLIRVILFPYLSMMLAVTTYTTWE